MRVDSMPQCLPAAPMIRANRRLPCRRVVADRLKWGRLPDARNLLPERLMWVACSRSTVFEAQVTYADCIGQRSAILGLSPEASARHSSGHSNSEADTRTRWG
jgi:hypothetical protein